MATSAGGASLCALPVFFKGVVLYAGPVAAGFVVVSHMGWLFVNHGAKVGKIAVRSKFQCLEGCLRRRCDTRGETVAGRAASLRMRHSLLQSRKLMELKESRGWG